MAFPSLPNPYFSVSMPKPNPTTVTSEVYGIPIQAETYFIMCPISIITNKNKQISCGKVSWFPELWWITEPSPPVASCSPPAALCSPPAALCSPPAALCSPPAAKF